MKVLKFDKALTIADVNNLNSMAPVMIELKNTKGQDPNILEKLDASNVVRIIGGLDEKVFNSSKNTEIYSLTLYSPKDIAEIIRKFEEIEKTIEPTWNELQKATHVYAELMQRIKYGKESSKFEKKIDSLEALLYGIGRPITYAAALKEALDRLNIPCDFFYNLSRNVWNEIKIGNEYYPVDLGWDAYDFHTGETGGEISLRNYLTDPEFYKRVRHKTTLLSDEQIVTRKAYNKNDVQNAFNTISNTSNASRNKGKTAVIEKPKIKIKSKELTGLFANNIIQNQIDVNGKTLKISISDNDFRKLKEDLYQISKYYPQLLRYIEIENISSTKLNMQNVINEILRSKQILSKTTESRKPFTITVKSKFEDDFDLDLTKLPQGNAPVITLVNSSNNTIKLHNIGKNLSKKISTLQVEGFDVSSLDLTGTGVKKLQFKSQNTKNINLVKGLSDIYELGLDNIPANEFNTFMSNIYPSAKNLFNIDIEHQDLSNRKILQEIAVNNNITKISVESSKLNDLDGLEQLDGRITWLDLYKNDLQLSDISRVQTFMNKNPLTKYDMRKNTNIVNEIENHIDEISDDTVDLMQKLLIDSGTIRTSVTKSQLIEYLLKNHYNKTPYYIKDAEVIRKKLNILDNPMMLKDDSEIDTIDFNADYLKNGELLLTLPQIEKLLQSGKVISQDVKIKIGDVTELSSDKVKELSNLMNSKGMKLSGVRIIDSHNNNRYENTNPYTLSQYIYIRDTIETIVSEIDPTDSDINKFAIIYTRLMDSIVYDHDAIKHGNREEELNYAKRLYSSRSLLEGLEEGKCVCAGYSDILRNALAMVGMDCRTITGLADKEEPGSAHAWNQVQIRDSAGNPHWYYTDLTWDAPQKDKLKWALRGSDVFMLDSHNEIWTKNKEVTERDDFDRAELQQAFTQAKAKSFNFREDTRPIDIPVDPTMQLQIDEQHIKDEFKRRKNDMLAKFYGNKAYQKEYDERAKRYREHEIEVTSGGVKYKTVSNYPEKDADEKFLLLDKYKDSIERVTKYEAGDKSVYQGTPDQINAQYQQDKEYVETRNHTFDQNKTKRQDLATLGKYGERVPYIQKQTGFLKNTARVFGNVAIFTRNLVSPIYRGIGKYVAQPIHKLVTKNKDASPYRNNIYHRIIARRDYFQDVARERDIQETKRRISKAADPSKVKTVNHAFRNALEARAKAIFSVKKGNEAVLRAGAADIMENIKAQEKDKATITALNIQVQEMSKQVAKLEQELAKRPRAQNSADVQKAINDKKALIANYQSQLADYAKNGITGDIQTDAISADQHSIASKEITTFETTAIKGIAKGLFVKLVGPKIHDWLADRGKVVQQKDVITTDWDERREWIPTTYKTETTPIYQDVIDTSKSMHDVISANKGKKITGFYSVAGGERRAAEYTLTGNENITAVFQSIGKRGTGLADKVDLTAPKIVDRTFSNSLLNSNGLLNQNVSINQLIEALNTGTVDLNTLKGVYVSVGDRYWTKLSDLVGGVTKKVKVDEITKQVVDVAGHFEKTKKLVTTTKKVSEVVDNPFFTKAANINDRLILGGAYMDGILDVIENVRPTTTEVKSNKKKPRKYDYDDEELNKEKLPTSREDYNETR